MRRFFAFGFTFFFVLSASSQKRSFEKEIIFRFTSPFTSFPDLLRKSGHTYQNQVFPYTDHYDDSSVLIIVPPHFKPAENVDMIFWFHGWYNSIDSSVGAFNLIDQFIASKRNALLVIPETSKKAPDSYGGKLEKEGMFRKLVEDIIYSKRPMLGIKNQMHSGNIILAGHSGAYRLIAHIIHQGGLPIQEVLLFDGLYGQLDKFKPWILSDKNHSFVHWYTNKGGGTDEVSDTLMNQLKRENIEFRLVEETIPETKLPQKTQILFVHSSREHNEVITNPDNFKLLIQRSRYLRKIKK